MELWLLCVVVVVVIIYFWIRASLSLEAVTPISTQQPVATSMGLTYCGLAWYIPEILVFAVQYDLPSPHLPSSSPVLCT
jgi:hypothetical protein